MKLTQLQTVLNGHNLQKEFRVTNLTFTPKNIQVVFHDNPGTMKKIHAFLDFFIPLLAEAEATRAGICPECGFEVSGGCWKLINGVAYCMHQSCADKVCREITEGDETRRREAAGNYFTGFVGALLGSVLGAVL